MKTVKHSLPWFLLSLAFLCIFYCEQEHIQPNLVATVGPRHINLSEFKEAYIPILLYTDKADDRRTREFVINQLIQQKILALEAESHSLDTLSILEPARRLAMKKTMTRLLSNQWVSEFDGKPTEAEMRHGFKLFNTSLTVRHLFSPDKVQMDSLFSVLQSDPDRFAELARETFENPMLAGNGGLVGEIKFGDSDPDFENAAYELEPGDFSAPVKTQYGWHIIRVDQRVNNISITESDYLRERPRIQKIIEKRKRESIYRNRVQELLQENPISFNVDIASRVWRVLDGLKHDSHDHSQLNEKTSDDEPARPSDELLPLHHEEMLSFGPHQWTVKDFLDRLPEMDQQLFRSDLKQGTALLIRDELLMELGIEQNLQNTEAVTAAVQYRQDQILANIYLQNRADSMLITEDQIQQFYLAERHSKYLQPDSLLIHEISASQLVDIENFIKAQHIQEASDGWKDYLRAHPKLNHQILGWFQGANLTYPGYYELLVKELINTPMGPIQTQDGKHVAIIASARKRSPYPLGTVRVQVEEDLIGDRMQKLKFRELQKLSPHYSTWVDSSLLINGIPL